MKFAHIRVSEYHLDEVQISLRSNITRRRRIELKKALVFASAFFLAPLFGLEPKTPWLRLRLLKQRVEKFCLTVLQQSFAKANRKSFCQRSLWSPECYLMRVIGQIEERKIKQETVLLDGFLFYGSPDSNEVEHSSSSRVTASSFPFPLYIIFK